MQEPATTTPKRAAKSSRRTTLTIGSWPRLTVKFTIFHQIYRFRYMIITDYRILRKTSFVAALLSLWSLWRQAKWQIQKPENHPVRRKPNCRSWYPLDLKDLTPHGKPTGQLPCRRCQPRKQVMPHTACSYIRKDGRGLLATNIKLSLTRINSFEQLTWLDLWMP